MKNAIRKTVSALGVAIMAAQIAGATEIKTSPAAAGIARSSVAFEQAKPVTPAQKEVERLLRQISSNAAIAGRHAGRLESFTRGPALSYETQASELTQLKEAVNAMGSDYRRLQELRSSA